MINFSLADYEKTIGNLRQLQGNDSLPEVVFSGRSNVGKSTLINKLFNRKSLARVSSKPGKTVNINFYKLKNCRFVDLPGYGYAKVSFGEKQRWSELVEGYFNLKRNVALVIQIIDMRHPPTVQDMQMVEYLSATGVPFVLVFSKCDKLNKTELKNREEALQNELKNHASVRKIMFSSVTSLGVENLKNLIQESVENINR